jgi:hypothetical protein
MSPSTLLSAAPPVSYLQFAVSARFPYIDGGSFKVIRLICHEEELTCNILLLRCIHCLFGLLRIRSYIMALSIIVIILYIMVFFQCIAIQLHLILRMQLVLAILFLVAILLQYNTIQYIAQYIGGAIHLYQALVCSY